jgi:alpha-ribazole phosphatase
MRVLIARHPPVSVPEGLCYGQRDVPLAPGWESWSDELALLVAQLPAPCLCLHSPLTRCREPALRLARDVGLAGRVVVRPEPALLELDFGRWDGLNWDEVPRDELDAWAGDVANIRPGGGESVAQMFRRCVGVLEPLRDGGAGEHSSLLLLSHSGPVRCLLSHALGLGPDSVLRLRVDLGAVSAVYLSGEGDRLEFSNRRPPLLPFSGFA